MTHSTNGGPNLFPNIGMTEHQKNHNLDRKLLIRRQDGLYNLSRSIGLDRNDLEQLIKEICKDEKLQLNPVAADGCHPGWIDDY